MAARPFGSAPTAAKGLPSGAEEAAGVFRIVLVVDADDADRRVPGEFHQERVLLPAGRAPGGPDIDDGDPGPSRSRSTGPARAAAGLQGPRAAPARRPEPACRSGPRAPATGRPRARRTRNRSRQRREDDDRQQMKSRRRRGRGADVVSHGGTSGRRPRASSSARARRCARWSRTARRTRPPTTRAVTA